MTWVVPGGNDCGVGVLLWIATPLKPPEPGECCCSWLFQFVTTVQLPLLITVASQCTVPSTLQEIDTNCTLRHTLHGIDVGVLVGVVMVDVFVGVDVPVDVLVAVLVTVGRQAEVQ